MKLLVVFFFFISVSYSLIIPDEVPSLLSVIYSNIPVLKKGSDSRLGWGFRLGDRADFQVLVELGPQTYTQPLANQGDSNNKRNTLNSLADTLYAQRQQDKQNKQQQMEITTTNRPKKKSEGGVWLENWSEAMGKPGDKVEVRPGLAVGEIDAKSVIPDDSGNKEKALDDVSLE